MSKTNCKNCGAALDVFSSKCAFCGTKNINLTDIDLASGEAANFIFKLPNNIKGANGKEVYLSMLAIPQLETVEMHSDPVYILGGWGKQPLACINNRSLELGLTLHAVTRTENNEICNLTVK